MDNLLKIKMEKKDLETIIELLLKENKQLKKALEEETKERSVIEEIKIFKDRVERLGLINFNFDVNTILISGEGVSDEYTLTFKRVGT